MAEVNSFNSAEQAAGRKLSSGQHNQVTRARIRMPVTYAQAAINDTVATKVVIPAGSHLLPPDVRNGTGTASCTLDIGLRKVSDGTVVDATALGAAVPIATAAVTRVVSGTKIAGAVDYALAEDCEVFFTVKGAVLAANALLQVDVIYSSP